MKVIIQNIKLPHDYVMSINKEYRQKRFTRDRRIISERLKKRRKYTEPIVGDVLEFGNGTKKRIAYEWDKGIQPGSYYQSYYLQSGGTMSYSGSLDALIPIDRLELRGTELVECWIFSQDDWKAYNSTTAQILVNKWAVI